MADVLAAPVEDPFTPDVVAVPARGVERWLSQRLAHTLGATDGGGDGVSANIAFPSPAALVREAVSAATGTDEDPWTHTTWRLLDVIDTSRGEPWCAPLARHLAGGRGRRLAAAQRLTLLFTSYAQQRPQMLCDWHDGQDSDGAGAGLAHDLAWQAELWRRLRASVGTPSPAERLDDVCEQLRRIPAVTALPRRLSVFGPTRLTTDQVAVLRALAEHRDVHLWLPHPSAALWDKVMGEHTHGARVHRREDRTRRGTTHPLLASLGRDVREMQLLLGRGEGEGEGGADSDQHHPTLPPTHHPTLPPTHPPALPPPDTLLGALQAGLGEDRPPSGTDDRPLLEPGDRSVQVHACHGRARQVEVLRELLLGLLEADPTLEPRDVLVMCPDIESYAPLISATFGLAGADDGATHPGHRLRVQLADRSLRQTNPVLATIGRLLDLADSRVTASQVLDLAASGPVRRRFRFDDEELERLGDWVAASGIRWGLDAAHRVPYRMEGVAQNTWQAGLDRVLVGATMSEEGLHWLGLALPLDDVNSNDIDLAGRLAELLDRLSEVLDRLSGDRPLSDWLDALQDALAALTHVDDADTWQLTQARRELRVVAEEAGADVGLTLEHGDVQALLAEGLRGRPTRAGFRTGDLTMCSMVPMRSVPHRVICLLGLDDGIFPRTTGVDGDDVMARDPLVGERDRRSEDRQLLLDAIMAAREHLVVLYTGADERTNTVRPPAVPVGEVLDALDATVRTSDGRRAREHLITRHPLQPFDRRNFVHGALGPPGPFSFDSAGLAGARAALRERAAPPPFVAEPLAPPQLPATIALESLIAFLEHPVRGFMRQRLRVATAEQGEELTDALQAELSPLGHWAIGDRWVRLRLNGMPSDVCRQAEWRRGALPPGALGAATLARITDTGEALLRAGADSRSGAPTMHDVAVALPDGRTVAGTVGVFGSTVSRTLYARLAAKHRLRAWVQLLMLSAAYPDRAWSSVTVGRAPYKGQRRVTLAGLQDPASEVLTDLVALYDRGLRQPLPLPLGASLAYAQVRVRGDDEQHALDKAAGAWQAGRESTDRDHMKVWGPGVHFADVWQGTDFGDVACRLWFPMLAVEQEESL